MQMIDKYSIASKARMKAIPKAKRIEMMKELGKKRQAKMSDIERKQHAKMMVNAREAKRNKAT